MTAGKGTINTATRVWFCGRVNPVDMALGGGKGEVTCGLGMREGPVKG